jgi:hypothetical protein
VTFAGGEVTLPDELLLSGKSGSRQVSPPERFEPLARMSDAALEKLSNDLLTLLESETRTDGDERLADYIDLLSLQCMREVMRRGF